MIMADHNSTPCSDRCRKPASSSFQLGWLPTGELGSEDVARPPQLMLGDQHGLAAYDAIFADPFVKAYPASRKDTALPNA